jgi:hypothetical protein
VLGFGKWSVARKCAVACSWVEWNRRDLWLIYLMCWSMKMMKLMELTESQLIADHLGIYGQTRETSVDGLLKSGKCLVKLR